MGSAYNRKDSYYEKAKKEGYRSRAAYKLIELQQKNKVLRPGSKVLDLGAWPGGWCQVAAKTVGNKGIVVGIDLKEMEPLPYDNTKLITGDVRDDSSIDKLLEILGGKSDVLLSDMSPKHTGIKEVDTVATVACAELALWASDRLLRPGGTWVAKVFQGNETEMFIRSARPRFKKLTKATLKSTRKSSNEFYLLGFGFQPKNDSNGE